jgi:hypothetical protein
MQAAADPASLFEAPLLGGSDGTRQLTFSTKYAAVGAAPGRFFPISPPLSPPFESILSHQPSLRVLPSSPAYPISPPLVSSER